MPNLDLMFFQTAKALFPATLMVAFAAGGAVQNDFVAPVIWPAPGNDWAAFSRAEQTILSLFPPAYRSTQRAIVTAGGKQFTCDGLLQVSPAGGHHLAIVSSFGLVTDLRVRANGDCELLKVTPLFREEWSRRFVARDLRWLFIAPEHPHPAGQLADGTIILQSAPDADGVTAQYAFSPDGARWRELDLLRNGNLFYRAVPKRFRRFAGAAGEIPGAFEVRAEAYRIELNIAELTVPKMEGSP